MTSSKLPSCSLRSSPLVKIICSADSNCFCSVKKAEVYFLRRLGDLKGIEREFGKKSYLTRIMGEEFLLRPSVDGYIYAYYLFVYI